VQLNDQPIPAMREVKVQVKLTSMRDADDAEDGKLDPSAVRTVTATGMAGTGAVRSVLPRWSPSVSD
jgi:translation elongation factor EF-G